DVRKLYRARASVAAAMRARRCGGDPEPGKPRTGGEPDRNGGGGLSVEIPGREEAAYHRHRLGSDLARNHPPRDARGVSGPLDRLDDGRALARARTQYL